MRRIGAGWVRTGGAASALWCVLIFASSLTIFLWRVDAAPKPYFDETWYVPTARHLLATGEMLHQEHPPLGKLLIAAGMAVFGDDPFGWRAASAVFGAVTLVGMFLWSYALFRDTGVALWTAAITFFDQFLYVQSRIATLDVFVMAFGVMGLAFFTFSLTERKAALRPFAYLLMAGVSLGLAGACKWSGFFLLAGIIGAASLIGVLHSWKARFDDPEPADFYGPGAWVAMNWPKAVLALGVAPVVAYVLTYLPQMAREGSVFEFVDSHRRMFEILAGNAGTHPYSSNWYGWPILGRPVWYLFELTGGEGSAWSPGNPARAVLGLANPLIFFAGEAAIIAAAIAWLRRRSLNAMIVTVGFWSQYLPWAINPKGLEFSYYYFPALLCAGPALALVLFRGERRWPAYAFLAAAALVFAFFLPVLSAAVTATPGGFDPRMWSPSWR